MFFLASRSSSPSAVVTPGRWPSSMSAWRSQLRRHESEIPKSLATCVSGASPRRATAMTSSRILWGGQLAHRHPSSGDLVSP